MKRCTRCHVSKPPHEFRKRLHDGRFAISNRCISCRAWERDYHTRPANQLRRSANRKRRAQASPRTVMMITLSHGLKRRPTNKPATIDDLMEIFERQSGRCALSGITMTWAKGVVMPTSLSLDRIDQNKGYSADNIRLLCHAINAFRGRMSDGQMIEMARAVIAKADEFDRTPSWMPFLQHNTNDWLFRYKNGEVALAPAGTAEPLHAEFL